MIEQNPQNTIQQENNLIRLDYTIVDPQERNALVHKIVNSVPKSKLTPYYLEQLTRYLVIDAKAKKEKAILTDNRMVTVNKRETSFEGLISKLENGEDGIYNFISDGGKNVILCPKIEITEEDIATIPGLKELREEIKQVEIRQKQVRGKDKYILTRQLIEMRQQQYALKYAHKPPIPLMRVTKSPTQIDLREKIIINEEGEPVSNGLISFFKPQHICCLLCNYSKLKEETWGQFENDMYYLLIDLENLADRALETKQPMLYDIMIYKIDGLSNQQILELIQRDYGITYSPEYLSSLWRKKIPKLIAEQAKRDWIIWHYTEEEKGKWKRCSRCREIKLAHPYFFSKNKTSKDGFYSLCKDCRNKKKN